ncbi:MAG TPA: transposase [Candidatus Kapabacteria bacterium]|jgi:REP element-mobilizing transposase RayT|nr:transposase [Candidatus Kapabacteria bacterium]
MNEPDYRRHLPHFTPNDAPYYITARLTDSLPATVLEKLQSDHRDLLRRKQRSGSVDSEEIRRLQKRYLVELDRALDQCVSGPKWLALPPVMDIVRNHLMRGEEEGIVTLWCFTIMPNHVHLLFRLDKGVLRDAMQLVKGRSAYDCNKLLARHGAFWQHESYDHVVRESEFARIVRYILLNPVKAGLVKRWQDWPGCYLHPSIYGFEDLGAS